MSASSPIYELLNRNLEIFDNKDVVIVGDIYDPMLLALVKTAKSATIVVDNFVVCQKMAAMIGQSMDHGINQTISYKHVKLVFAPIDSVKDQVSHIDSLVILLSKNKQQTLKLITALQDKLDENSFIYTAGANDGGGKSADTILKAIGHTKKQDLARKCTLFKAFFEQKLNSFQEPKPLNCKVLDFELTLAQDVQVFSQGKLDNGTKLLLESLKDIVPQGKALDLGCGCGVISIVLSKLGFKDVTASDVSATALKLTSDNAKAYNLDDITVVASDMLSSLDKYDLIAVNPPFHVGLQTTTAPTISMIMQAREHLTEGGCMYMVANAHLHYEKYLTEYFDKVEIVNKTTTFIVYKAS